MLYNRSMYRESSIDLVGHFEKRHMIHTGDTDLFDTEWELNCSYSILPGAILEPLGVRASASNVMTKFGSWVGDYPGRIFPMLHNNQNNGYLYDITFIFDRCHRSYEPQIWTWLEVSNLHFC